MRQPIYTPCLCAATDWTVNRSRSRRRSDVLNRTRRDVPEPIALDLSANDKLVCGQAGAQLHDAPARDRRHDVSRRAASDHEARESVTRSGWFSPDDFRVGRGDNPQTGQDGEFLWRKTHNVPLGVCVRTIQTKMGVDNVQVYFRVTSDYRCLRFGFFSGIRLPLCLSSSSFSPAFSSFRVNERRSAAFSASSFANASDGGSPLTKFSAPA